MYKNFICKECKEQKVKCVQYLSDNMNGGRACGPRNGLSRPRFDICVKQCVWVVQAVSPQSLFDWIWSYCQCKERDQYQTYLSSKILTSYDKLLFEEEYATSSFVEFVKLHNCFIWPTLIDKGSIVPARAFIVALWPCSLDHSPYVKHSKHM